MKKINYNILPNDDKWIQQVANIYPEINKFTLSAFQIKIIRDLFNDYVESGMPIREALKKAINISMHFKT
jgi:hypothetical protein